MKLVKAASGKQNLRISRKEWESIGKTAGWTPRSKKYHIELDFLRDLNIDFYDAYLDQLKLPNEEMLEELPMDVTFTVSKGSPQTRNQPAEHPEIEIETITIAGIDVTKLVPVEVYEQIHDLDERMLDEASSYEEAAVEEHGDYLMESRRDDSL